jgi:hypothetical protein
MRATKQELPSRNDEGERATSPRDNGRDLNYQSFPDNGDERIPLNSDFRGFSTSINDMFTDPDSERIDCCAMACCGILQADRDRYLITGVTPPSCFRRFWLHICLPIWIFVIAMLCAVKIPDPWLNEFLSTGFVFCVIGYFIIQCVKGAWKRRQVRKDLLWSKFHFVTSGDFRQRTDEDSVEEERSGETPAYFTGQTRSDIKNSHGLCGCYATDRSPDHRFNEDKISICTRFFQCFTNACCGKMCGMHFQLCGICGVAQEARQLEDLLHAGYRRIDYITMQPYMEYYPAIYKARNSEEEPPSSWSDRLSSWWDRLSLLSKLVLKVSLGFCTLLLIWSLLAYRMHHKFGPENFIVFCATLFQAYFLLTLVHWNHTQDVSTDALIKFFASGFCLSTTIAVFYELVVGFTIRLIMTILMAISGIDVVEENGYALASPGFGNFWNAMQETGEGTSSYKDYLLVYGKEHPFIYTIYLFIYAFFLAAMIEELAKYFGFRMVEHPDFLSRRNLEEAAECECVDDEEEESDEQDFSDQDRSLQSRGAAITVSMVAASLGFACCENLIYIFVYGEATFTVEIFVLLARSLFPVHPIAAALQSVRVCQRDLEKQEKTRLGRIIFPGVMFHGLYDFFLMWIVFLSNRNANYATDDDEAIGSVDNSDAFSIVMAVFLILGGSWYYLRESRSQRKRLQAMDRETSVDQSRLL